MGQPPYARPSIFAALRPTLRSVHVAKQATVFAAQWLALCRSVHAVKQASVFPAQWPALRSSIHAAKQTAVFPAQLTNPPSSVHSANNAAVFPALPLSYQTTYRWLGALQASAKIQGTTWLHALHLGVMLAERGDIEGPIKLFMKPNPIALRNLVVMQSTPEAAWPFYQKAWKVLHSSWTKDRAYNRVTLNLITEISFFLQQELWYLLQRYYKRC